MMFSMSLAAEPGGGGRGASGPSTFQTGEGHGPSTFWTVLFKSKRHSSIRAVASLTVARVPLSSFFYSNFNQFFLFFLKLYLFFPSFWPSGWSTRPPGKTLATPLPSMHKGAGLYILWQYLKYLKISQIS